MTELKHFAPLIVFLIVTAILWWQIRRLRKEVDYWLGKYVKMRTERDAMKQLERYMESDEHTRRRFEEESG